MEVTLRKKTIFSNGSNFFVGADGDGAAPINGTAGAAGDTSRPYKCPMYSE